MARKSRRRTNRPRPRPQFPPQPQAPRSDVPAGTPGVSSAVAATAQSAAQGPRVGGDQALVRSVEMSLAPPQQLAKRGARGLVLETGDAAIPLDRVPYFTSDLRRLGVTAGVMVALLVVAAVTVIPQVVK